MASQAERAARQRIRALLARLEPQLRQRVQLALDRVQGSVSLARLERSLESHDAFAIHDLAATLPVRLQPAVGTLAQAFRSGLAVGAETLPLRMRFNRPDALAAAAAREYGARLVTRITDETRAAIRTVIARAFNEGIAPREAAKLLRPMVGLTQRFALAVLKYRDELRRQGATDAQVLARSSAYAQRLVRMRAVIIARTEIIAASTRGQLEAWNQAVRKGLIRPGAKKVWMVTDDDRLCPLCRPMDGQERALAEPFVSRDGQRVIGPPLHPQCRCALFLRPAAVRRAA